MTPRYVGEDYEFNVCEGIGNVAVAKDKLPDDGAYGEEGVNHRQENDWNRSDRSELPR